MTNATAHVLIETDALENRLADVQIIDLSSAELHAQAHIPGAKPFDYAWLVSGAAPAAGSLPALQDIVQHLEAAGISSAQPIVAYDGEGSGKAARFCWTLDVLGFNEWSLLNGGLAAWAAEGRAMTNDPTPVAPATFAATDSTQTTLATADYIKSRLGNADTGLLDARTPAEHAGTDVRSARGGHIPGARNVNWIDTMDPTNHGRFLAPDALRAMVTGAGLSPDQEVITYCQTHHRSAHSYVMLKSLGFTRIRGYAGSWSEWGNLDDTPIETG